MAIDASNIYHGPIVRLSINAAIYTEIGGNNATITFESTAYEMHDGEQLSKFGVGKVEIELVGATPTIITAIKAAKNLTTSDIIVYTQYTDASNYTAFTISDIMLNYKTKRGFGDDPHILLITGTKKTLNESNFVTRTVASS